MLPSPATNDPSSTGTIEFPYPSGQGLHVGHPRPFTAMDIVTRKKRMQGYNVLFPIGFDAFGLPTENYAIKNHIHPAVVTKNNIENFTKQLKMLGYGFDWDRCVDTTDPKYYKWTQWIFLQMFKHGLAYKSTMPVNWCTSCKCVLANEEVVNGVCERCGSEVIRKEKSQWMLKITEYAQRLIDDLDDVDYIERVKIQQRNWIGRSTGAEITFDTNVGDQVTVYTTRADTLFGTTYMVISPEHPLLKKWQPLIKNWDAVAAYQEEAAHKSDFERGELNKEKTGVRLEGIEVMNPVTHKPLPMFVSDYVLMGYGTGIVMGVPGHDQRDWEFAKKFGLPIIEVVAGGDVTKEAFVAKDDSAVMVNSGFLNGLTVKEAIPAMKKYVVEQGFGKEKVNYKLRDWVFSRQRYWGEPIPLVNCEKCGWVALPEEQLPLVLPQVESYGPTDDGESPLSKMTDWVNTTCPCCGGPAKRETDTMPQWAGSSWYFLRYMDPHNDKALASKEALDYWSPVDWYNGGMEHTTLHLLYSRFWHKFLYDIGVVPTKEPLRQAHQPRHDPGRGWREDVQVPRQRGQPQRHRSPVRRGHHAPAHHVHRRLREGRQLEQRGCQGQQALPGPLLQSAGYRHRRGVHLRQERVHRPQDHQEGQPGYRRAEDEHRYRRHDDHGQRVLRQWLLQGRRGDALPAAQPLCPPTWWRRCGRTWALPPSTARWPCRWIGPSTTRPRLWTATWRWPCRSTAS